MGAHLGIAHDLHPHCLQRLNGDPRPLSLAALLTIPDKAGF